MTGAPSQAPAFAVTPEIAAVLGGAQQLSGGGEGNFERCWARKRYVPGESGTPLMVWGHGKIGYKGLEISLTE